MVELLMDFGADTKVGTVDIPRECGDGRKRS